MKKKKVKVRLFAKLREIYGFSVTEMEVDSIEELQSKFKEAVLIAVNGKLIDKHVEIKDGDTIDLMPPFSGG